MQHAGAEKKSNLDSTLTSVKRAHNFQVGLQLHEECARKHEEENAARLKALPPHEVWQMLLQ